MKAPVRRGSFCIPWVYFRSAAWPAQTLWSPTAGTAAATCPSARWPLGPRSRREGGTDLRAFQGVNMREWERGVELLSLAGRWILKVAASYYDFRGQTDPTFGMTYKVMSSECICCARFKKQLVLEFLTSSSAGRWPGRGDSTFLSWLLHSFQWKLWLFIYKSNDVGIIVKWCQWWIRDLFKPLEL